MAEQIHVSEQQRTLHFFVGYNAVDLKNPDQYLYWLGYPPKAGNDVKYKIKPKK